MDEATVAGRYRGWKILRQIISTRKGETGRGETSERRQKRYEVHEEEVDGMVEKLEEMDEIAEENEREHDIISTRKSENGRGETREIRHKGYEVKEEEIEGRKKKLVRVDEMTEENEREHNN